MSSSSRRRRASGWLRDPGSDGRRNRAPAARRFAGPLGGASLAGPATDRTASVLPQELIRTKRDGGRLPADAVAEFVAGMTAGSIGEGQAAGFALAVFFRGLDRWEECRVGQGCVRTC